MKVSQFTEQQRSSLARAGSGPARLATTASMPPTRRLFRNSCQQQRPRYQHCRGTLSPLCIASTENRKTTLICVRVVLGGVAMRRRIRKLKYEKILLRGLWPFIRNFAPTKISRYTVCRYIRQYTVNSKQTAMIHRTYVTSYVYAHKLYHRVGRLCM